MEGSKYSRLLMISACIVIFVMCKSQEKASYHSSALNCEQLIESPSQDSLYFVGRAESGKEEIVSEKAKKESTIQLIAFFQTEIIEAEQFEVYSRRGPSWGPPELEKEWSEVSREMISSMHSQELFPHKQDIEKSDNDTYTAIGVLTISEDWVRDHWAKSFAATDSTSYLKAKASIMFKDLKEMDIEQEDPCKQL